MTTEDNLKEAFAGESQANRRYLAFASKADKEGLKQVARLFRAAAAAETVHAQNHLEAMEGVKGTAENLQEAIDGETHEFTEMYPKMIKAAEADGNQEALKAFRFANQVEKEHAAFYQKALEAVKSGKDLQEKRMLVCPVCGHTVEESAPESCPICGTPGSRFLDIE